MTMHLQTSKEMLNETSSQIHRNMSYMGPETESQIEAPEEVYGGWWKTRSKMEKKLVVLSAFLFLLSFCLIVGLGVVASRQARHKGSVVRVTAPPKPTVKDISSSTMASASESSCDDCTNTSTDDTTTAEAPADDTTTSKTHDDTTITETSIDTTITETNIDTTITETNIDTTITETNIDTTITETNIDTTTITETKVEPKYYNNY